MILHLFRRTPRNLNIASLYGMIVAQARSPEFYRDYGVPDTVNGRFEMIALHAVLFLARLEQEAPAVRRLGQGVFDLFCREMDASMREMGVGDLAVPRKMRRIGAAFYERQREYRDALATADNGSLEAALARNVLGAAAPSDAGRAAGALRPRGRADAGRAGCRGVRALRASLPRSGDGRDPRRGMTAMARAHGNSDIPEPDRTGTGSLWSAPLALGDVPETGRRIDLIADATVRAAIAKFAGLRDLPRLEAAFDVTQRGHGGLRVTGHVRASVGQDCVVTLEPVENEIDEPVDLAFAPADAAVAGGPGGERTETPDDDAPEPLVGGTIDLGAIATEFLLLAIDPYPRKPGAVFQAPPAGTVAAKPFAALAVLKKGQDGSNTG